VYVQDGRLRVNDQLVDVNGVSLSGMDNARAIQVLREAMMKDVRVKGFIGITVLRPPPRSTAQTPRHRELRVSEADDEDATDRCVSALPRPDPSQRLPAAGGGGGATERNCVADPPVVSLSSDIAQVGSHALLLGALVRSISFIFSALLHVFVDDSVNSAVACIVFLLVFTVRLFSALTWYKCKSTARPRYNTPG